MNDYEKTIEVLQNRVRALEQLIQPVKWQPKGGRYYVALGEIYDGGDEDVGASFGIRRETFYQASRAASEMRKFNRLLALRDELCGDELIDWGGDKCKYFLQYDNRNEKWALVNGVYCQAINVYFTTKEHAQRACDMLNSGELEL